MPQPYRMTYSGDFDLACLGLYGRFMNALKAALGSRVVFTPLDDTTLGVVSCTARDGEDLYVLTVTRPAGEVSVSKGPLNKSKPTPLDARRLFEDQEIIERQ